MRLFAKLRARLAELVKSPPTIAERAAPRIQARLRKDATTRRGNVPQFAPGAQGHPGPTIPILATAKGDEIVVTGPKWVLDKAAQKGQHEAWAAIVREEARKR